MLAAQIEQVVLLRVFDIQLAEFQSQQVHQRRHSLMGGEEAHPAQFDRRIGDAGQG